MCVFFLFFENRLYLRTTNNYATVIKKMTADIISEKKQCALRFMEILPTTARLYRNSCSTMKRYKFSDKNKTESLGYVESIIFRSIYCDLPNRNFDLFCKNSAKIRIRYG